MTKKYNILKDEKSLKHILAELHYFCLSHENCTYCPFHCEDCDSHCRLLIKDLYPEEFIYCMGDED